MNALLLMFFHVLAALLISAIVLAYLRPALNKTIDALCTKQEDTQFWQRYTVLMMTITPVILMLMFSDGQSFENYQDADELRTNLLLILLGQFLGLVIVGRTLWKTTQSVLGIAQKDLSQQPGYPGEEN